MYRLIPIFNPFYMSTLLVSSVHLFVHSLEGDLVRQVFKIVAPYTMLSVSFALLNDALGLPPFSLLLVALTLTDGTSCPHPVSREAYYYYRNDAQLLLQRARYRLMVRNRTINHLLLHCLAFTALVGRHLRCR